MKNETVDHIHARYEAGKDTFIDVRQPEEWEEGVIPGAKTIMLAALPEHLETLDKSASYVMVCRSGVRSGRASDMMANAGFSQVVNFDGGMLAWYEAGHPTE